MVYIFGYPVTLMLNLWYQLLKSAAPDVAWVLALIGLVVTVRLIILPFAWMQARTGRVSALMRPYMKRIDEALGDRTDTASLVQASQLRAQVRQHFHYRPAAGCFPPLIQLFVFIGLYRVIRAIADPAKNATEVGVLDSDDIDHFLHTRFLDVPLAAWRVMPDAALGEASTTRGEVTRVVLILLIGAVAFSVINMLLSLLRGRVSLDYASPFARGMQYFSVALMVIVPSMLVVLGFFGPLPVALLIYWFFNSLWTLAQTTIIYIILDATIPLTDTFHKFREFQINALNKHKQQEQQERRHRKQLDRLTAPRGAAANDTHPAFTRALQASLAAHQDTRDAARQHQKDVERARKATRKKLGSKLSLAGSAQERTPDAAVQPGDTAHPPTAAARAAAAIKARQRGAQVGEPDQESNTHRPFRPENDPRGLGGGAVPEMSAPRTAPPRHAPGVPRQLGSMLTQFGSATQDFPRSTETTAVIPPIPDEPLPGRPAPKPDDVPYGTVATASGPQAGMAVSVDQPEESVASARSDAAPDAEGGLGDRPVNATNAANLAAAAKALRIARKEKKKQQAARTPRPAAASTPTPEGGPTGTISQDSTGTTSHGPAGWAAPGEGWDLARMAGTSSPGSPASKSHSEPHGSWARPDDLPWGATAAAPTTMDDATPWDNTRQADAARPTRDTEPTATADEATPNITDAIIYEEPPVEADPHRPVRPLEAEPYGQAEHEVESYRREESESRRPTEPESYGGGMPAEKDDRSGTDHAPRSTRPTSRDLVPRNLLPTPLPTGRTVRETRLTARRNRRLKRRQME